MKFEAILVYIMSFMPAKATLWDPVSKKKKHVRRGYVTLSNLMYNNIDYLT